MLLVVVTMTMTMTMLPLQYFSKALLVQQATKQMNWIVMYRHIAYHPVKTIKMVPRYWVVFYVKSFLLSWKFLTSLCRIHSFVRRSVCLSVPFWYFSENVNFDFYKVESLLSSAVLCSTLGFYKIPNNSTISTTYLLLLLL